jgi:hypothetical protein
MRTSIRSRAVWIIGVVAVIALLALSACARGGNPTSSYGQTTTQQTSGAAIDASQAVQSADQSVQDAMSALNDAASAASVDYSSQDMIVQP